MNTCVFLIALGVLVLAAAPLPASERLYDDFSGHTIGFGKWKGAGGDFWMAEADKIVEPDSEFLAEAVGSDHTAAVAAARTRRECVRRF